MWKICHTRVLVEVVFDDLFLSRVSHRMCCHIFEDDYHVTFIVEVHFARSMVFIFKIYDKMGNHQWRDGYTWATLKLVILSPINRSILIFFIRVNVSTQKMSEQCFFMDILINSLVDFIRARIWPIAHFLDFFSNSCLTWEFKG